MIEARNLSLIYSQRSILGGVDFQLSKGELVGLVGPNGAGKTSLMRAIMGFIPSAKGECDFWLKDKRTRAQFTAWLGQERALNWDLHVEEIVELARLPWQGFGAMRDIDREAVDQAIARLELQDFRKRRISTLSGGERARVYLARVLAQDCPVIFADEPIAALDPAHQIQAMKLFLELAKEGRAVLISIHDLGLAARFCTRICLMNQGGMVSQGSPEEVLTDQNLEDVFGIQAFRAQANGLVLQPIEIVES